MKHKYPLMLTGYRSIQSLTVCLHSLSLNRYFEKFFSLCSHLERAFLMKSDNYKGRFSTVCETNPLKNDKYRKTGEDPYQIWFNMFCSICVPNLVLLTLNLQFLSYFTPICWAKKLDIILSIQYHIICESNSLASCIELFQAHASVFVINRQIKYHCKWKFYHAFPVSVESVKVRTIF